MNQVEILSAMACLVTSLLLYVAAYGLAAWVRPHLQGRLAWLVALVFPALKLEAWLFEPIAECDLPPKQREFFHAHTPSFIARNYEPLGDFVLLR
ncbi:MAG TPA: hypothetical protein VFV87_08125, partial [Pirellulaceae bacterium]|nr:hypothetical protein [Pirellulaceae bacterium]